MPRRAGLNVPLFSARSSTSWGIGELRDFAPLSNWLADAGFSRLMLLPLGTIPDGETSPYSATSTMSIDPMYISLDIVPDFHHAGGVTRLSEEGRIAIENARQSPVVLHDLVRRAKQEALTLAFSHFLAGEWALLTPRAAALAAYTARERWWLDDYALFQALSRSMPGVSWRDWPSPLRDRDARTLDDARRQLSREVLQQQYWQWIAEGQWQDARAAARAQGVSVVGDLPFLPNGESPEVWSRADEFLLDVSAGVPPDAFSEAGQDWGLPTYRWETIRQSGYAQMHQRGRRMASLFDALRIDHVVGLYRSYGRPPGGKPYFIPADQPSQLAQGEAVIAALKQSGIELFAEDLGVVPDWVRESLTKLGVPGCRVLRWERDWHAPGSPFLDPGDYPPLSVAMSGTHDTEPVARLVGREPGGRSRRAFRAPILCGARLERPESALDAGARRRTARAGVSIRIERSLSTDPGSVRLAGSGQHAGDRRARELDLVPAVAGRSAPRRRGSRGARPLWAGAGA